MIDLALAEDLQTVYTALLLNSDEEAVGRMLNHAHSIVSLSDAGAHLTFFNDAGFGLHLLGHWARELKAMTLGEAVRRASPPTRWAYTACGSMGGGWWAARGCWIRRRARARC